MAIAFNHSRAGHSRRGTWRAVAMLGLAALLGGAGGCGPKDPMLTFRAQDGSKVLKQRYGVSAMARDDRGDYDLVLSSQGLERLPAEAAGKPVGPSTEAPVRQVVHMKIHWRPRAGTSPDNPAAANASLRWLIFGAPDGAGTGAEDDVLEYQGTAFVLPSFGSDGYTLRVRKGELKRSRIDGEMVDALGPAAVEGTFFVRDDAYTVANVLKHLPAPAEVEAPKRSIVKPATRPGRR